MPEYYYHIFNRAIGDEKIFRTEENYKFFLQRFYDYILPIGAIYCYCLLPNHFHFLIRILPLNQIKEQYKIIKQKELIAIDNDI